MQKKLGKVALGKGPKSGREKGVEKGGNLIPSNLDFGDIAKGLFQFNTFHQNTENHRILPQQGLILRAIGRPNHKKYGKRALWGVTVTTVDTSNEGRSGKGEKEVCRCAQEL